MTISDFTPFIQLGATIAIAVVAIESAKSYTKIIADRIFKFPDIIKNAFNECLRNLPDKETLDHLEPIDINGRSTISAIEKVKIDRENMAKRIDSAREKKTDGIAELCQSKSLSSLSLVLFIYNIVLLFSAGIERSFGDCVHVFVFCYTALIFFYLLMGWIIGERDFSTGFLQFSSLRHSTWSSFILLIIALILSFFLGGKRWGLSSWYTLFCIGIFLIYINFIVFAIKIGNSASDFKKDVSTTKDVILKDCLAIKKETDDLLAITRIGDLIAD